MVHYTDEGYRDPTAGEAMKKMPHDKKYMECIKVMLWIARQCGYCVKNKIVLTKDFAQSAYRPEDDPKRRQQ